MRRIALALLLASASAAAGTVVSDKVDAVSVTLYRDPDRREGGIERNWPGGYALITETRRITVPAGRSVVRFEGVSEGMLPESAIVTGLPEGVVEKNRDGLLLSPAGLVDAYLTRRVHLRRTNRTTGAVREQQAIIRAGPGGGVVLQTSEGIEALSCSGLPERLTYDGVPEGLSAKPALSVVTESASRVAATVTLSYLAQGFDWAANYVVTVADDGRTMDMFAWMTIANGGAQSFPDAGTQAVAGQPSKRRDGALPDGPATELRLQCWPMDVTSTHPRRSGFVPPPPPPAAPETSFDGENIVVTAQRRNEPMLEMAVPVAMVAVQEDLGDLKLYRIPEPVTVAALGQKQVAMIDRRDVPFERFYRASVDDGDEDSASMEIVLRTKNVTGKNLGLPLPAGAVAVFEAGGGPPLLVGEGNLPDRAIGEDVELAIGKSPDVRFTLKAGKEGRPARILAITNARPYPVDAEIMIPYELRGSPKGLVRKDGGWLWRATVPANGTASLRYALKLERE